MIGDLALNFKGISSHGHNGNGSGLGSFTTHGNSRGSGDKYRTYWLGYALMSDIFLGRAPPDSNQHGDMAPQILKNLCGWMIGIVNFD